MTYEEYCAFQEKRNVKGNTQPQIVVTQDVKGNVRSMKPQPAPQVPGDTDAERFSNAVKMVLSVPPGAVTKEKKRMKRAATRRKKAREQAPSR